MVALTYGLGAFGVWLLHSGVGGLQIVFRQRTDIENLNPEPQTLNPNP